MAFIPFVFSLLMSNRCRSYSRNGRPSDISFAFNSDLRSFFVRHTWACKKQPRPVIWRLSGISIVASNTSGTIPCLYERNDKFNSVALINCSTYLQMAHFFMCTLNGTDVRLYGIWQTAQSGCTCLLPDVAVLAVVFGKREALTAFWLFSLLVTDGAVTSGSISPLVDAATVTVAMLIPAVLQLLLEPPVVSLGTAPLFEDFVWSFSTSTFIVSFVDVVSGLVVVTSVVFNKPISPDVNSRLMIAAVPVTDSTHTSSL